MSRSHKSTEELLLAYGYEKQETGLFFRGRTQAWFRAASGGWHRFDPPSEPFSAPGVADPSGGQPWGVEAEGLGWIQTPYRLTERFESVSGLHPATHPECFIWEWPDDVVAENYQLAIAARDAGENRFVRLEDGTLAERE